MRRALAVVLLLSGCFDEAPDPDRTIAVSVTQPIDMGDEESSSGSEAVESTSEESGESSSSSIDPSTVCPEWCTESCDTVLLVERCRCLWDTQCGDGTECMGENTEPQHYVLGHCV